MKPALVAQSDGTVQLQGELTVHTVTPLLEQGRSMTAAADGNWTLDLSPQTGHFSSAAVALLLDWLRLCEASGKTLAVINPPQQFGAMITICGLDDIFSSVVRAA